MPEPRYTRREALTRMTAASLSGSAILRTRRPSSSPSEWRVPNLPSPDRCRPLGVMADRIRRSLARLARPPYDRNYILADLDFNQKRSFTEYSGDISGRIVGISAMEAARRWPQTWPLADLLPRIRDLQKPDGHFGVDQDLKSGLDGTRDTPLLWGNGRMLIGLVEAVEATGNPDALLAARRLGDYYVNAHPYLDRPEWVRKFGSYAAGFQTCYFSGIEGLARLASITRDARYRTQAGRMIRLMRDTNPIGEQHSHGRLCALRGYLDLYEATRDRSLLDDVVRDASAYREQYLFPTGGIAEMTIPSQGRNEGCTEADWLRLNLQLWRLTGDDRALDSAEMTLRNEMAACQWSNGGFGHLAAKVIEGRMDGYLPRNGGECVEATWCCSMHGPRALMEVPSHASAVRGRDVFVNLYEPVVTTLDVNGSTARLTILPSDESRRASVTVECPEPLEFTMRLRVPAWTSGFRVTEGPGSRTAGGRDKSGRWIIRRTWTGKTVLNIAMPHRLDFRPTGSYVPDRASGGSKPAGITAIYLGPDLMARPMDEASAFPETRIDSIRVDELSRTVTAPDGRGGNAVYRPLRALAADGEGFRIHIRLPGT